MKTGKLLTIITVILSASSSTVSGSMHLGAKCNSDAECQAHVTINSRCFEERCSCQPYHATFNETTCLESTLLGFDCLMDAQCSLKTANSVCIEGSCGCDVGFLQFRRHTCLKPAKPGEVCYSNAHCLLWDSDSHCEFMIRNLLGRCMCNTAQKQRGNTCLPGSERPMVEEPSNVAQEPEHSESIQPSLHKKPPGIAYAKTTKRPIPLGLPEITVSSHVISHVYPPSTTHAVETTTTSEYFTTSTKPFYDNSLPEAPPVPVVVLAASSDPMEEDAVAILHKAKPSDDNIFVSQIASDNSSDTSITTEHLKTDTFSTEKPSPQYSPSNDNENVTSKPQSIHDEAGTEAAFTEDKMASHTSSESAMAIPEMTSEVASIPDASVSEETSDTHEATETTLFVDVTSPTDDLMSSQSSQQHNAVMTPTHTTAATRTRLEDSSVAVSLGLRCDTDLQCLRADAASLCVDGVCDCAARGNGSDACGARNRGTHPFTFQCRSTGLSISWFFVCDGRQDCADGSDEECQESGDCPTGSFRCGDGSCVSLAAVCDGVSDCSTGLDEARCKDARCPANTFRCADGTCLPEYEFCNAVVSCSDGSDEPHDSCKTRSKRRTQYCPFRCGNGRCRSTAIVCSGKDGCGDGSDEAQCSVCKCPAVN